jgi:lactoylglutathione lyase
MREVRVHAQPRESLLSAAVTRPGTAGNRLAITFLYYRDLPAAIRFYEHVLGLTLAIDQGWSKIYRITDNGYVGLVDETRGSHRANPIKPVQLCIRVADVDAWYAWVAAQGVADLRGPKIISDLKIKVFVFSDPEGYQIEIQSALD